MYKFMGKSRATDTRGILSVRKRDIQNKKTQSDMTKRNPHTRGGFLGQGEMNNSMQDRFPGLPDIQFTQKEDIERIIRICRMHNITLTYQEASDILDSIDANLGNPIRILNHNRTIVRWQETFRTRRSRFAGMGPMGRASSEGASVIIEDAPPPDEWVELYKMEATIDRATLSRIKNRSNLNKVMGGSASRRSGIQDAEYLHKIGHQLGGVDEPDNLMVGYHALNTAMIPIENFVFNLAKQGVRVHYIVAFEPRVGTEIWTQTANIGINMTINGQLFAFAIRLSVPSTAYISNESYNQIVNKVREIAQDIYIRTGIQYRV